MKIERSSGILLHITSLPGKYGIGTLGYEAYQFADILKKSGQKFWQILPIGPVNGALGYSPYASASTFAGNYLFISLEKLSEEKWFSSRLNSGNFYDEHFIYYENVISYKLAILVSAANDFFNKAKKDEISDYESFCDNSKFWLHDYALFSALADHFKTNNWLVWDKSIALRDKTALREWELKLHEKIRFHKFLQYLFFKQWTDFKLYCIDSGIKIIGDIPIYITLESADAWANPEILQLDKKTGKPCIVAGVPPDYFSKTGQRWGNPIYNWMDNKKLNEKTLSWWVKRISHLNKLVDIIRIDHFRGFEAYWAIPEEEKTAVNGEWIQGPGIDFFLHLHHTLGDLPLIAEDLGVITPEVEKLRDDLGFPGMKILQFAFDFNNKNYYLPHNISNPNCILYTGTHDNNTTNGWFYGSENDDNSRKYIMEYLGIENYSDFNWKLIRQAYRTIANLVILPAQDILGYGSEFRMNTPGTVKGNWGWKLMNNGFTQEMIDKLKAMGYMYDRIRESLI